MGLPAIRRLPSLSPGGSWTWPAAVIALAAGLLAVYLSTLAPGLTWANQGADGGDLITAAAVGGVAHPTGYPTYLLLARLAQLLPAGSLAYRTNLLSAFSAALASAVVALGVERAHAGDRRYGRAGGLAAGLAFGLSPGLWSQAVIAEVYALHALLVGIILFVLMGSGGSAIPNRRSREALLLGVLLGLAIGNHLTSILLVPPWLIALGQDRPRRPRSLAAGLTGLGLGLLVYAYVPLRARTAPAINWGGAVDGAGLWWLVSGQAYRGLLFGLPAYAGGARLSAWAGLLLAQFGSLGMVTAAYGFFLGRPVSSRIRWLTAWTVVAFSSFAIGYVTQDSTAYLLPAFLAIAIWLGMGMATALEAISGAAKWRGWVHLAAAAVVLSTLINAGRHLPEVDGRRDGRAESFGRAAMRAAPAGAMLFTQGDRDTFALWYFHFALGERPDVRVIVEPMLGYEWYRASLRSTYPALVLPAQAAGTWRQALRAANGDRPECEAWPDGPVPLACIP